MVRVSTCVMRKNMLKVKSEYLIFKTSIAVMKICLLINNRNKAKFINKSFVHANMIPSFEFEKPINLVLRNCKAIVLTNTD